MTDDEERVEWFKMRDSMIATMQHNDPSITRELALEAMALTFWKIIAGRIEPVPAYETLLKVRNMLENTEIPHVAVRNCKALMLIDAALK